MWALRQKIVPNSRQGGHGRRATTASGDGNASGEGARHRVSVSQRGL
jgi:hypothetical protein